MKLKFFVVLSVLFTTIACNRQAKQIEKDMTQLSFNPEQAVYMTAIACNEAKGDMPALEIVLNGGLDEGLTVSQIKEALSQLYAYTGFPRSLNALNTLQKVLEQRKREGKQIIEGQDVSPLPKDYDAFVRGGKVQTQLSGGVFNYDFSPAIDYYLKAHLFGDIFIRDNLTYADRELVTVSALSGLEGVDLQLKAHISGARNMGVTEEQLQTIVVALATKVGTEEAGRVAGLLQTEWPKGQPNTAYSQYFVGKSFLYPYLDGAANVTFAPGCRNNWHIHHGVRQILICVSGRGWYQEWGKSAIALHQGDVIDIPEGVKHWHGAQKDSWFQHIAFHVATVGEQSNEWLESVSEEEYGKLE